MKLFFISLAALLSFNLMINESVFAAAIEFPNLDVAQGFKFNKSNENSFGHLISLQIGSTVVSSDVSTNNPVTNENYNIVGPIAGFRWSAVSRDPMELTFNVSKSNRQKLKALIEQKNLDDKVVFNFQIFTFDPTSKVYFIGLKSFTLTHAGIIQKVGKDLPQFLNQSYTIEGSLLSVEKKYQVEFAASSNKEVTSPENYTVRIGLAPSATKKHDLVFSNSTFKRDKFKWSLLNQ